MKEQLSFGMWSAAVLVMLTIYGPVLAQQEQGARADAGVQSATCFSTHTNSSGASLLRVCFSDHGNLMLFESPSGLQHLQATSGEGYAVCTGTTVHGFDAGATEVGFGPSIVNQPNGPNTFPLTITRNTTNGIFQLRQTFAWDTTEKDVVVTMTLMNWSDASQTNVQLVRYFNGNVNNDAADDLKFQYKDQSWDVSLYLARIS